MSRSRRTGGARATMRAMAGVLSVIAALSFSAPGRAADYDYGAAPQPSENTYGGVACRLGVPFWVQYSPAGDVATAETLPWPSVYYGHFSGGRPYKAADGQTLVDWRDEHVCFSSRANCREWVEHLFVQYYRPEGYWTCTFLR